ncbi:transposase IS116/IS110/IS902 family protein [Luteococcus japonicus]|uniref:Transposase IS116/IS110/IS902 family protein n=1 Tax=Luteococcus japonicus TaxID=33984 RepID=A0A3N1ZT74_9ACTN|nr:IS110 family transposase [Luteococcus japonicus]ROR53332.1 transposase IS116/IS110/IS902 family protein [Luteococcus japonicus]
MNQDSGFDIWCGLDVGKQAHHACALDAAGKRVFDKPLPQDQKRLEELFDKLQSHGRVLVVVDQPNTIGALPIAVARSMGIQVAYLPGLAMRRAADLYPGNAKTDARDAFIIADAARTMPHTLRRVDAGEETLAELKVLVGFDEDLAAEATRLSNRIRGLLTQIHPALERVVGPRLTTKQGLAVVEQLGGPQGMAAASKSKLLRVITKAYPRNAQDFADAITQALTEQTVTVAGTAAAEQVLPKLAASLRATLDQRAELAVQVEKVVDAHPLAEVLTSMPGVGVRTAARILLDVGDASQFPTAGHLAAYAGLAPVTRRSGTSIRGEFPARSGNKHLKRALFLSAFAALKDPTSRAYYDRKRAQGKKHNAALICLSRRRCDVLFAMIKNREPYRAPAPTPEPSPMPLAA